MMSINKIPFLKDWSIDISLVPEYNDFRVAFVEELRKTLLQEMLKEDWDMSKYDSDNRSLANESHTSLQSNIVDQMVGDIKTVHYNNRNKIGRFYSDNSGSICDHPRVVKGTLFQMLGWVDIDMVKGHPTLLAELCRMNNLICPSITFYINNSDQIFDEMDAFYGTGKLSRSQKKWFFNLTIYGGGATTWYKGLSDPDSGYAPVDGINTLTPFMVEYLAEVREISELIVEDNQPMMKIICQDCKHYMKKETAKVNACMRNKRMSDRDIEKFRISLRNRRVVSYVLTTIENEILYVVYQLLAEIGILKKGHGALEKDGLCFPPQRLFDNQETITHLNQVTIEKTGFAVRWDVKSSTDVDTELLKVDWPVTAPNILDGVVNNRIVEKFFQTTGYVEMKDQYVRVDNFHDSCKGCIIKSPMGSGKTQALVEYINATKFQRIVVISPRISFGESICKRLESETGLPFKEYRNLAGNYTQAFIVVSFESIYKLVLDERTTLIVMDEVESILTSATSVTNGENHVRNIKVFEELCRISTKIIALDAFISNKTLEVFRKLDIPYDYYLYTRPMERRTAIRYPISRKDGLPLIVELVRCLNNGEKIYFYCSSARQWVDYFKPYLLLHCPNKIIKEYHSRCKDHDIKDVNTVWSEADLVMVTCSVTVGANYDRVGVFNKVFMYINAPSKNLVRDAIQCHFRVRHTIDKVLCFSIDERVIMFAGSLYRSAILNQHYAKLEHTLTHLKNIGCQMDYKKAPRWLVDLFVDNTLEQNASILELEPFFLRYLVECNYDVQWVETFKNDMFSGVLEYIRDFDDIADISKDQFEEFHRMKMHGKVLSECQKFSILKYRFIQLVEIDTPMQELWEIFTDKKKNGSKIFRTVGLLKSYRQGTLTIPDLIKDGMYLETGKEESKAFACLVEVYDKFDLHKSDSVTDAKIRELVPYMNDNEVRFRDAFSLRKSQKKKNVDLFEFKDAVTLLKNIIEFGGETKLIAGKRGKVMVEGKRVDTVSFTKEKRPYNEYISPIFMKCRVDDVKACKWVPNQNILPANLITDTIKCERVEDVTFWEGYNPMIENDDLEE